MVFDNLKHRIHNFKLPIRNKRTLRFVQCIYFLTPIVGGCMLMQYITPDPEDFRKKLNPSEAAQAASDQQSRVLQATLDAARASRGK